MHYRAYAGAAYAVGIQQARNEAYAQDKTTQAPSSCTSQIKSNIVCYSIAEVFHDKEKYMELVNL